MSQLSEMVRVANIAGGKLQADNHHSQRMPVNGSIGAGIPTASTGLGQLSR